MESVEQEPAAASSDMAEFADAAERVEVAEPEANYRTQGVVAAATAPVSSPPMPKPLPPPEGSRRLSPDHDIWINDERGVVIIDGNVSFRQGPLEMFACTRNTKEHESIVSANTLAHTAHTALLFLGAEEGTPVRFDPKYEPPTGTEIEILLFWADEAGDMQEARAQDWVRDAYTGKPMTQPWVFAGSGFWKDDETGQEFYMAEQGDFICLSNFSTAMLDVPIESSQSQDGLLFEAHTERIPPLGTPVRMILRPKLDQSPPSGAQ